MCATQLRFFHVIMNIEKVQHLKKQQHPNYLIQLIATQIQYRIVISALLEFTMYFLGF